MTAFTATPLDLSRLDPSPIVSANYQAILADRLALLLDLWNQARAANPNLPALDTLGVKSTPGVILNEEFSTAEMLILQQINDAAKALRLAQATDADLDHLAATYHRSERLTLVPATESAPAVMEANDEYRARAQLAPEGLAEFGLTPGGYVYNTRKTFGDRLKDVQAVHRGGGHVELFLLGRDGDGTVGADLIAEVVAAFRPEDASQSTDILTVLSSTVVHWTADVTIYHLRGPSPAALKTTAEARIAALGADKHKNGAAIWIEAVEAAAHVAGAERVVAALPATDIAGVHGVAPWLAGVTVRTEVI